MRGSASGFFRVLSLVGPHIAMQVIRSAPARHELPNATRSYARNRIRMEAGFCLRKVDQVLGNAFFPQDAFDHLAIASAAGQAVLESAASAMREIIDVARDLIGHHQRKVGMRGLDLSRSFGFQIGIYRIICDFVGFVNRRGFRFLLVRLLLRCVIASRLRCSFEGAYAFGDSIKFLLETRV